MYEYRRSIESRRQRELPHAATAAAAAAAGALCDVKNEEEK
jgi:hypothetical protein